MSGAGGAGDGWSAADARTVRWLVACAFLFYLLLGHGHFKSSDEIAVYEGAAALWERGELVVGRGPHVFAGPDGSLYSHFAIGQSVLALPLYGAGKLARHVLPKAWSAALAGPARPPRGRSGGSVEIAAVSLYGAVASALLVGLFFRFERELGASARSSVAAAAALGAGTYVVMHSAYFLRHTTEGLTLLAALLGFHLYRRDGSLRALAWGSVFASATFLVRLPAAIAAPALAGYLLFALAARRRARDATVPVLAVVLAPLLAALAIHVGVNHARWGLAFGSPMTSQLEDFTTPLHVGLFGLLLSPGASIFLYSPPLLLLPWLLPRFWRSHRAETLAVLALSLTFLLVASAFWSWSGLWASPGPRYLFVAAPLLLLPLGLWLDDARGRGRWRALGALALAGAIVELGVTAARWRTVVHVMDYRRWEPGMEFLFVPSQSPVLAAWNVIAAGEIDCWLFWLADGWAGQPGRPGVALLLLALWALLFAACARGLVREVARTAR